MSSQYYLDKTFTTDIVPIGTGMYKVSETQSSYLTLVPNNNWWDSSKNLTLTKITVNLYSSIGKCIIALKQEI